MKRLGAALTGLLLAFAVISATDEAAAQGVDELGAYGARRVEERAPFLVELRFGRYRPQVDEGLGGATPYADTFGDTMRFAVGAEFDYRLPGLPYGLALGPGLGWSMTRSTANALLEDGSGRSSQRTSLTIMPMYLVAVLRVESLQRYASIPVIPYAKAGLGYALWWSIDDDVVASDDGVAARGSSYGPQFALGAMLDLTGFDRSARAELRHSSGVLGASAFAEWYVSSLDGFGSGDQMQVGTNTWVVGLAVCF